MRVIDAQIHLWARETSDRPWPEYGRSYAHGKELLAEEAISWMDEAGVDAAILCLRLGRGIVTTSVSTLRYGIHTGLR